MTESAETQTLESILASNAVLESLQLEGGCALLPPTSSLTGAPGASRTRTASTNVGPDLGSWSTSVMVSQAASDASVAETSVQTEDCLPSLITCSTTETQTYDCDLPSFCCPEDLLLELNANDIETQTIWNSDETTQTDGAWHELLREFELLPQ